MRANGRSCAADGMLGAVRYVADYGVGFGMALAKKPYLIGGGVGSLAAAAFLIRDAAFPGGNIFIFDREGRLGGSLDAAGDSKAGYSMRGGRMFTSDNYECTWDLFKSIPSLSDPRRLEKPGLHRSIRRDPAGRGVHRRVLDQGGANRGVRPARCRARDSCDQPARQGFEHQARGVDQGVRMTARRT
jgi:hypothetical protein